LTGDLTKAQKSIVGFGGSTSSALSNLASVATSAFAAVGLGLAALTLKGVSTFETVAGEVRKLEGQLGTTAEQASVLRAQGQALGVGVDQLSTGFGILSKHLVANDDVLQQYGIDVVRTADGQIDFQAVLAQLSATFGEMGPGVDRTAAAMNLFGRSGKALLPLLAANSDELATFAEHAAEAGLIMSQQDVDAARALTIAQRELGAAWEGLQVQLARAVIPMLTSLAEITTGLVRTMAPFLPLVRNVGLAFAGWKALTFIPELLLEIAQRLDDLDLTSSASQVLELAVGAEGLGVAFTTAATAAAAFAVAFAGLTAAVAAWDPLGLAEDTVKLRDSMTVTTKTFGNSEIILGRVAVSSNLVREGTLGAAQSMGEMQQKAGLAQAGITNLSGAMENEKQVVDAVTLALRSQLDALLALASPTFALIEAVRADKEAEDRLAAAHHALNVLRDKGAQGTFKYRDALKEVDAASLNAVEAQTSLFGAVRQFQQEVANGNATRREAITAIKDLGKEAGLSGKEIRALVDDVKAGIGGATAFARQHAPEIGAALAQGVVLGITTHSELISVAAAQAVHDAIAAAKREAEAESPSKKMAELGHDLMEGLKNGITDKDRQVAQAVTDSIGKMLDAAKSAISDFRSKMRDFAGGISGGFASFSDFVGGFGQGENPLGIQDFLSSQLAGAQGFADVLDALKRQGASKGLLSQIAGAGPEGLGFAQALLQGGPELVEQASQQLAAINRIADHEGGVLSKDFFGNKMDKLQGRADRIAELLAEANRLQSGQGGDITLVIDGKVLAKVTRDQLVKLGNRNAGTGLN